MRRDHLSRGASEIGNTGHDALAQNRMVPHCLLLVCGQRARLEQDRIRDADLPEIVEEEPVFELRIAEQVRVDRLRKLEGKLCDPLSVTAGLVVAQLERCCERSD